MEPLIVGNRRYVEVLGDKTHELPPLLVRTDSGSKRLRNAVSAAELIVEEERLVVEPPGDDWEAGQAESNRRKIDLAINLAEHYSEMVASWNWGDSVLAWIKQCEAEFEIRPQLRNLLKPDIWPHASRCSFVALLEDKAVSLPGTDLKQAVGIRLTFCQPPPVSYLTDQFLFYLKAVMADRAYQAWASMAPQPASSLPPERFHFETVFL